MISNEFKIMNQNDVRQSTYEYLLWGRPSFRFHFIFSAFVLIISVLSVLDFLISSDSDTDMLSTLLCMTVVVIMNIAVIIKCMYTSNKAAKRYNDKEKNLCLTIENSDVTYKVMEGDKEIQSTTYSVNDVKGLYRVKNYSFLIMN
ncbi:MAG: hypothetical protein K6C69_08455, partial [Lachnospiraceae bacterium]|nr:hypothetical protein [Lachnospiraceae bacterium]